MRPSTRKIYQAIEAYWDTYNAPPSRDWLKEYTGLSQTSVQMAIRHLEAKNLIYAPKHESYIGLIKRRTPVKKHEPWEQEPVVI